ncbi:MAG: hydroxymethylbilane synthase [Synechococcales cyanobacterium]
MTAPIRIGTRRSDLALVQARWVQGELQRLYPQRPCDLVTMNTQGDIILDVALSKIGDKGLFTKELEVGLLHNQVDLAVHSLKDLPTRLPDGLILTTITKRENPADALVVNERFREYHLENLPSGTVVGTSSLRRLAQLRYAFPHLVFKDIRGNLNTRLAKLDQGDYDALILAVAGLERLGMADRIHEVIAPTISLHAVGQGALGIECAEANSEIQALLEPLTDPDTRDRCLAERALLRSLEGGCQVPIGVYSEISDDMLILTGMVASLDGQTLIRDHASGSRRDPEPVGLALAEQLKSQGASEILAAIFATHRPER